MCSDIVKAFKWLCDTLEEIDGPSNDVISPLLNECLDCVNNIIPHHCVIHENCKQEICGFVKLKEEHPDWTDKKLFNEEYDKKSHFNNVFMLLSEDGMKAVQNIITKNVNKKNIKWLCAMKSSNSFKNFWNCATVHSEGKQINLSQMDAWASSLYGIMAQK